jgi:hypothetical protein
MELTSLQDIDGPVFYSANFGGNEPLTPITCRQSGLTVLITDLAGPESLPGWDRVLRMDWNRLASTPRKAARLVKQMPHVLFPRSPWSVWFDATHNPQVDLSTLSQYLRFSPIACFSHPCRTTVAEEARACIDQNLDRADLIRKQLAWFESVGFPDNLGLYGTACVVRSHSPLTASLNQLWSWATQRWSHRDQLSFPWALWMLNLAPACLQGRPRGQSFVYGVAAHPNPYFAVTIWRDPPGTPEGQGSAAEDVEGPPN